MADSINTVGGNTNVNNERVIKSNKPQGEEAASRSQESDNGVRSVEVELSDEIRQAEERAVFDEARVKEMRDAIEAGTFPLDSRRIAENFAELESLIS
jgi:negative regulator of flagellin synthesis FlgM